MMIKASRHCRYFACIVILADASWGVGCAFLPPRSAGRTCPRDAVNADSAGLMQLDQRISSSATVRSLNLFRRRKGSSEMTVAERQKVLVKKAEQNLKTYSDRLAAAIKEKGDETAQEIGVETVKFLMGSWDFTVKTTLAANETQEKMEGSLSGVAGAISNVSGGKVTKDDIEKNRLRFEQKVDAFAYPLRLQTEIFFRNTQVVRFYGRLSFDVIAKELEFDLDEVISLGVKLDLASTVKIAEAEQEEEQITESSDDRPSFWKRIFRKRKASSEDTQTDEDSVDDTNGT